MPLPSRTRCRGGFVNRASTTGNQCGGGGPSQSTADGAASGALGPELFCESLCEALKLRKELRNFLGRPRPGQLVMSEKAKIWERAIQAVRLWREDREAISLGQGEADSKHAAFCNYRA